VKFVRNIKLIFVVVVNVELMMCIVFIKLSNANFQHNLVEFEMNVNY